MVCKLFLMFFGENISYETTLSSICLECGDVIRIEVLEIIVEDEVWVDDPLRPDHRNLSGKASLHLDDGRLNDCA